MTVALARRGRGRARSAAAPSRMVPANIVTAESGKARGIQRPITKEKRPTRQEVFFFGVEAGDPRFPTPAMPAWVDFKELVYGVPDLEGRGFKLVVDAHGPPFNPDSGERLATAEGLASAREHLARLLPGLRGAPVVETRVCQYENTPHGDFLVDRHPDFENVWLVGGGSGHGFKHGPALGEYVAGRVTQADTDLEPRFILSAEGEARRRLVY